MAGSIGPNIALRLIELPFLVSLGLSSNAVGAYFIGKGIGGARQSMQAEYRRMSSVIKFEPAIRGLKEHSYVPKQFMTEVTLRRERDYRATGRAEIYNIDTGLTETRIISLYTNALTDKDSLTRQYEQATAKASYKPNEIIMSVDWFVIEHYEGRDY